ncbi:MAG: hypothetical protein KJ609_10870 [Gammaproteobacteria bacterium]|jgi:hypothetical protein|nr:hypothetical protein [Gammaproteobacteria bacterium]MBU1466822.1 hypothetical protein [Gammaproteobacteria bacterium]MBU2023982.1 hypothetical protein [Gammaproteobacteria bacterium]MBU2239162.1 hypothetical protein [Gammaproteobacteria bacterium]MBU2319039.1 hypothetical protein [Gammaproteobacteria bacterium]|tara:strand:+ start:9615 stop:9824 length:210 start_codon:yes stop_codon:yes gene_type:complete
MGISDHDYVNFSEDYELNHRLKAVEKRQTQGNRDILVVMGKELKAALGKTMLLHSEFHPYVVKQKARLE